MADEECITEKRQKMTKRNVIERHAANDSGSVYDTNVKYLLSDKQILSRILKYTIDEFQEMDIKDLLGCIGDDIEIEARPVDAGPDLMKGIIVNIRGEADILEKL